LVNWLPRNKRRREQALAEFTERLDQLPPVQKKRRADRA
jgi:hypothetical protein